MSGVQNQAAEKHRPLQPPPSGTASAATTRTHLLKAVQADTHSMFVASDPAVKAKFQESSKNLRSLLCDLLELQEVPVLSSLRLFPILQ